MGRIYLLFCCFFFTSWVTFAQPDLDRLVDFKIENGSLEEALYQLGFQSNLNLTFSNDILPENLISIEFKQTSFRKILTALLKNSNIQFRVIGDQVVLFLPKKALPTFIISGYLQDKDSGERLVGGNVFALKKNKGTSTNAYGFFSLELPQGKNEIAFSYLGYQRMVRTIDLRQDQTWEVGLIPSLTLKEVIVVAREPTSLDPSNYLTRLSGIQLSRLPTMGGESDIFRLTTLLPGVTTGADGIGGINVRGGGIDQNLFLLDGVTLYNPTHLVGLFSVFNSSAIKSATFAKGRFPARYGGRLSSVLDVTTKDGNMKEWEAEVGLGLSSVRFSVEGPLIRDKSSLFISARTSPLKWVVRPVSERIKRDKNQEGYIDLNFYDINAKINYTLSNSNKLFLSFYKGGDYYHDKTIINYAVPVLADEMEIGQLHIEESGDENLRWGNTAAAFRWNHLFSNRLFLNTSLTYSRYQFKSESLGIYMDTLTTDQSTLNSFNQILFSSDIQDISAKVDFDYSWSPNYKLRFGGEFIRHQFTPGLASQDRRFTFIDSIDFTGGLLDSINNAMLMADEEVIFIENEVSWKNWTINLGTRLSRLGTSGTTYWGFNPRLNINWSLRKNFLLYGGISFNQQNLHLLSTSGIGLPADLWVPSTARIRPQRARQIVLGGQLLLPGNFQIGIEAYTKRMKHLIEYSQNASFSFINTENFESNITRGWGRSKGVEFQLDKKLGQSTGILSYTLSKTERIFAELNNGEPYPYRYDRRHNIKFSLHHRFNENWEASTSFVYGSGLAVSLPTGQYDYFLPSSFLSEPINTLVYSQRNGFRLPANHRLDIELNYKKTVKDITHRAGIGIYNVYNRKNALYYRLGRNPDKPLERAFLQASLVPILPYLQYSIRF